MGCDIHYVVEKKIDGCWVGIMHTDTPFMTYEAKEHIPIWRFQSRDYAFFAKLAGVRGKGPTAKGLPADSSQLTQSVIEQYPIGYHSHSHYSLIEFASKKLLANNETTLLNPIAAEKLTGRTTMMCTYLGIYHIEDLNSYRVVFWFDN